MRTALASLLFVAACSGTSSEAPRPEEPPSTVLEATPREAPAEAIAIGWDHLPLDPDAAARAANAEALRIHGHASGASEEEARRVYEGSLAAFQRVASDHPDYLFARFNAACALARLGRSDEAIAILRALLALDLPTFGPRLDADPDLASLPSAPGWAALSAYRSEVRTRYEEALAQGAPLVHVTPLETISATDGALDGRVRRTVQAGVWLSREHRFVPMAPRLSREVSAPLDDLLLTAAVVDREHDAVLVFEGLGSWSEGGGPIEEGTLVAYEAGTGIERARLTSTRAHPWCPPITAHATGTGASVRFVEETEEGDALTRTAGDPFDATVRPQIAITLAHASVILPHGEAPEGISLARDGLRFGEITTPLPPAHRLSGLGAAELAARRGTATWLRRDAQHHWLLTAGIEQIEWDSMRAVGAALSAVTVEGDAVSVTPLLDAATGVGALIAAPDGAAYAQIGDRTYRLEGEGAPELLPEGLRILAGPPGAY